jgi:hypothetical protein
LNATDRSWLASALVAWFSLLVIALLTVPVLSWAFDRFNVSRY